MVWVNFLKGVSWIGVEAQPFMYVHNLANSFVYKNTIHFPLFSFSFSKFLQYSQLQKKEIKVSL